jgi:DNA-directed RNA polymerase subunit RPC12/RpoP
MMFCTHPLTVEGYRARTAADVRDVPMTAYSYKCAQCGRYWNQGTAGRKKAVGGGWRCPDCVK